MISFFSPYNLTNNAKYERNSSSFVTKDGYVWTFYVRADTLTHRTGNDIDDAPYRIYYKKSTHPISLSGGISYGPPNLLDSPRAANFYQRDVSAFKDPRGIIWVFVSSGDSGSYRPLQYYKSTDQGSTWTSAVSANIPGESNTNSGIGDTRLGHSHVIFSNGHIHLVYQSSGGSAIKYSKSSDGITWSDVVTIYGSGHYVPKIYESNGTLYVATSEGAVGKIWLAKSTDGNTWAKAHVLGSEVAWGDWDPFVFRTIQGLLIMTWAPGVGSDGQQIKISYSTDDGSTWTSPVDLTTGKSGSEEWWDYWPEIIQYSDSTSIIYTSEKSASSDTSNGGNIWHIPVPRTDPFASRFTGKFKPGAARDILNIKTGISNVSVGRSGIVSGQKIDRIFN